MLSRATLAQIRNTRASTSGLPLFSPDGTKLFDRPYVINGDDNLDSTSGAGVGFVAFGSFADGVFLRRTPVITRTLLGSFTPGRDRLDSVQRSGRTSTSSRNLPGPPSRRRIAHLLHERRFRGVITSAGFETSSTGEVLVWPAPIGISIGNTHGEPSGTGASYQYGKTLRGGGRRENGSRPTKFQSSAGESSPRGQRGTRGGSRQGVLCGSPISAAHGA